MKRLLTIIPGILPLLAILFIACSTSGSAIQQPADEAPPEDVSQSGELTGILATRELSVGTNRIAFLLTSPGGLVKKPQATVSAIYFPDEGSSGLTRATTTAPFHLWPYGTRGNYVTELSFDQPGAWALEIEVSSDDGDSRTAHIPLRVRETSITPAIGAPVPLSKNKTVRDVADLKQLSSAYSLDPDMYQLTIADAVSNDKPLMVVFSSPAFCTTPTCGPQLEAVQALKGNYEGEVNFIHVEVYENIEEVQEGGLNIGRYVPAVWEWHLPENESYLNESWVFVVDSDGRLFAKFEGFAATAELEAALRQVLQ